MASPSIKVHFIVLDVRQVKKNAYEQHVREVEHATFTPIVLAAPGGMAKEAETSLHAAKWEK